MPKEAGGASLVSRAMHAVRDHIRENDLKVGDLLPGEAYFADAVSVSRAVIREAFGALAALQLIDVANGRRARVGAVDGSVIAAGLDHAVTTGQVTLADVWDVRRTLELRTAELAATERTDAEAAEIVAHAEAMVAAAETMDEIGRHGLAMRAAIARATHNALFVQLVRSFTPLLETALPFAWRARDTAAARRAMLRRQRALAQAIADKKPVEARKLMRAHFDAVIIGQAGREGARAQRPGALLVWRGMDAKQLVETVRVAARRHNKSWEKMVPDEFQVDLAHEEAEELAYAEMAAAKRALRDHICETYGITIRELASLATP